MNARVIILRGLPGSGKTTFIKAFAKQERAELVICSSNDSFVGSDGVYRFKPEKLGDAHDECFRKFSETLQSLQTLETESHTIVAVDNTATTLWEMAPYRMMARRYGLPVEFIEVGDQGDIDKLVERNVHGVPESAIRAMRSRFAEVPPFWEEVSVVECYEKQFDLITGNLGRVFSYHI